MFSIVSSADKAAALAAATRVKAWLGDLIVASERDVCTLMVTEVECKIPGCAPLEVVLVVLHDPDSEDASGAVAMTGPSARWVAKVMVPLAEVTAALVADAAHDADNALPWRVKDEEEDDEEVLVARLEVALEALAARQAARQLRDAATPPTLVDVPCASLIARLDTLQRRVFQQRKLMQGRRRLARTGGGGGGAASRGSGVAAAAAKALALAPPSSGAKSATHAASGGASRLNCPCCNPDAVDNLVDMMLAGIG